MSHMYNDMHAALNLSKGMLLCKVALHVLEVP